MRIRSIKPEFWRSPDIDSLDWHQRLIFIGLWSYVDDNGVGDARVASIAADLFASDLSVDPTETLRRVSLALDEFELRGMIIRYSVGSRPLLYVTNWTSHQIVKNPSKGNCYPLPPAETVKSAQTLRRVYGESTETLGTGAGEQGSRGTGELGSRGSEEQGAKDSRPPQAAGTSAPDRFAEFWQTYPRKVGKDDARNAWKAAKRRADQQAIIDGSTRLASDPNLPETQFIPYPATWLRRGGWDDEPLPPRRDGPRGQPPPRIATADQRFADGMALVQRLAAEESQTRLELEA